MAYGSQPTTIDASKTLSNQRALATRLRSHGRTTGVRNRITQSQAFELGRHEPDLLIVNSYGRLANVSMELIVDDEVSAEAFRKRLGKELTHKRKVVQHSKKG